MPRRSTCFVYRKSRGSARSADSTWTARVGLVGEPARDYRTGLRDKRAAESWARDRLKELELQRVGVRPAESIVIAAQSSLLELVAEYVADLAAQRCAEMHTYNVERWLSKLAEECGWRRLGDVDARSFIAWRSSMVGVKGGRTLNHYLSATRSFFRWLVKSGRWSSDPLACVEKVRIAKEDKRRPRRAATPEEAALILQASGPYQLAYLLGLTCRLRRSELEGVRWSDLHLEESEPYLVIRARIAKNARTESKALRADVVRLLRASRPDPVQGDPPVLSSGCPSMDDHRKILESVGILFESSAGRLDLHAWVSNTPITIARARGVTAAATQRWARHSSPSLTDGVYTDRAAFADREVFDLLPSLPSSNGAAEGVLERVSNGRAGSEPGTSEAARPNEKVSKNLGNRRVRAWLVSPRPEVERNSISTTLPNTFSRFRPVRRLRSPHGPAAARRQPSQLRAREPIHDESEADERMATESGQTPTE